MRNVDDLNSKQDIQRKHILATGQVQGVGFRPFVYGLAIKYNLTGKVGNTSQGVSIEVQGQAKHIQSFIHDLQNKLPPLAKVDTCNINAMPLQDEAGFEIITSQGSGGHDVLISADTSICAQCTQDILDPQNRRYDYAFTNCTNCGPRYTITHSIPYDRATTSMACFKLCPSCHKEYENPLNRRFHAQPNACPICGPETWYVKNDAHNSRLDYADLRNKAAIEAIAKDLVNGEIIAIKGLGGFHLSCDATNADVLVQLRKYKNRPHKPLAVMVPDLAMAKRIAHVGPEEEILLNSSEKPIVLCARRENSLPQNIAPNSHDIGIVLPYTPLHLVLMTHYAALMPEGAIVALVMTSGNAGGEPICLGNREAFEKLGHIAQSFLLHNRDILVRTDDSVCTVSRSMENIKPKPASIFFRRARGYVPRPIKLGSIPNDIAVLGMGAELKSTLCLSRGPMAFVSQHIGDLQNVETLAFYHEVIKHLEMLLAVEANVIVHDLHPNFMSTQVGKAMARERDIPCISLQHHFAHAWSVLGEHNYAGEALALSLDGTGLGLDNTVWGGELLYINTSNLEQKRLGRLSPFALPGGDAATKEPWRIALALAMHSKEQEIILSQHEKLGPAILEMLKRSINCPQSSSVGRLFDAVAAGLKLCTHTTYEGQAAICLEYAQSKLSWVGEGSIKNGYTCMPYKLNELWELSSQDLFLNALAEKDISLAARRFHVGLAQGFVQMAMLAAEELGVKTIALSGGAMQNVTLYTLLPYLLKEVGFNVLLPKELPANDGAISFGQVVFGRQALRDLCTG